MKTLKLTNGVTLEVTDISTTQSIIMIFNTKEEVKSFWDNFTEDSLLDAYLGEQHFSAIPIGMRADIGSNGKFTAYYFTKPTEEAKKEAEIQAAIDDYTAQLIEEGVL